MAASMADDAGANMQCIDIAPQGDLILVVQNMAQLRVHSFVMRLHAPDFFVPLLGPHFAEGQAQGTTGEPHRIQLPEDCAKGMMLLCGILHLRHDLIDGNRTGPAFRELAIVADKYNCVTKIQPYLGQWLDASNVFSTMFAGAWLHALYVLDDAESFSRMSEMLILNFHDTKAINLAFSGDDLADETIQAIMTSIVSRAREQLDNACSSIEQAVSPLLACLKTKYNHSVNEIPHVDREPPEWDDFDDRTEWSQLEEQCKYLQNYVLAQMEALVNAKIYPPMSRPDQLQSLLDQVAAFKVADVKRTGRCCSDWGWCDESRTDKFPRNIEKMKRTVAALNCALCLDCFRAGGWNEGKCRVHPNKKKPAQI